MGTGMGKKLKSVGKFGRKIKYGVGTAVIVGFVVGRLNDMFPELQLPFEVAMAVVVAVEKFVQWKVRPGEGDQVVEDLEA